MKKYVPARRQENVLDILGLPLHPLSADAMEAFIDSVVVACQKALVFHLNIHGANLALRHPRFRRFFHEAHLVFCDGEGIRWGARLLGLDPPPKVALTRWIWRLCAHAQNKGYRVYLLGAKPGVALQAANRLREKFPALKIAGCRDGYFQKESDENEMVIQEINRLEPDLLVVCFGMPLQEKWICDHWKRINAHVFLPAGAVLDYVSGGLKEAPSWMVRLQMEWLFRIGVEPKRLGMRYLVDIPCFFFCIFLEGMKRLFTLRRFRKRRSE